MRRRTIVMWGFCTALLVTCSAAPASGVAAPSQPAWTVSVAAYPTKFLADPTFRSASGGPAYQILATNIGTSATSGQFEVSDSLPVGVKPSSVAPPEGNFATGGSLSSLTCKAVGQLVTCKGGARAVRPGEYVDVYIPIEVEAGAPAAVSDEARIEGGGAAAVGATTTTPIDAVPSLFDFPAGDGGLSTAAVQADAAPSASAGGHPYQLSVALGFTSNSPAVNPSNPANRQLIAAGGGVRDVTAVLPQGVVANPEAAAKCTTAQFDVGGTGGSGCPASSQVGVVAIPVGITSFPGVFVQPVYNMKPPPGAAGAIAFEVLEHVNVMLRASVRSDRQYEISAGANDFLAKAAVLGAKMTLWGSPSDESHDGVRGKCLASGGLCPVERTGTAFLTLPTACSGPLTTTATADSWEAPGVFAQAEAQTTDLEGNPIGISGCNGLEFEPTIEAKATTNLADSPSGLDFDLHQPQSLDYEGLSNAALKDTKVTLPQGMTLNPSAGSGLDACSSSQIGLSTPTGQASPIHFSPDPEHCSDASTLGRVEVATPLLDHSLQGAVYLARPYANPFDSLLAIYLVVEDKETGIVAKLAGKVAADPSTGQLTASFAESPELPLEDVKLHLFNGSRAALTTPLTCGTKTTVGDLTPWSTPEGQDAHPTGSFQTSVAAGGSGACPTSEASAPNAPSFMAGTVAPQAGVFSPLVLRLARADGSQRLTGIDATLPKGLTGKPAGIPYCSEAQIAQAQARSNPNQGAIEKANPSCPLASEVGSVEVGAGSGPTPLYVSGHAYWAGPYKGAPLSLAIVTPAVAGPFDLGTVVVRTALYVDPESARIHAVSDPFPSIIQGIPLDIRSVSLKLDRPDFILNPTSCDPMSVIGAATTATGQSAALTSPFQVGGCGALNFKPKIAISLKGATRRSRFPALKAVVSYPQGSYANIASAQVTLPHGEFLAQGHIGTVCTRVQFAADQCPAASIYGKARAVTPLLEAPLEGPVYLRSSSHRLPDLVVALNGQIDVDLVGRVDTGKGGGIRNTFEAVPDAPISSFVLEMEGGKEGLLVNSEDICRKQQRAVVDLTAQNGKVSNTTPLIANSCGAKKQKGKKGATGHRHSTAP